MPSDERREKWGGQQAWEGRGGEGAGSVMEIVLWTGGTTSLSMCSKKIHKEPP